MFTQRIAIDLGTANTIIIVDGQIVVDEPSVVAIRRKDEQMVAVGRRPYAGRLEDLGRPSCLPRPERHPRRQEDDEIVARKFSL